MSFIDGVLDCEDQSPTSLDWTMIKDGLKWKTLMQLEKAAYSQRVGLEAISDEVYLPHLFVII